MKLGFLYRITIFGDQQNFKRINESHNETIFKHWNFYFICSFG